MHTSSAVIDAETSPGVESEFQSELAQTLDELRRHHPQVRTGTARARAAKLMRLRARVLKQREAIVTALHADLRKPAAEADLAEVLTVATEARLAARQVARWMRPQKVQTPLMLVGAVSQIRYEPKGVVLIIAPWNYPFVLSLVPLIGAVAAGCSVVVKPSEHAPRSSRLIKELLAEVFDPREVVVIEGDADVAEELLHHRFDHIFFTGGTAIGKRVMQAAAAHLTPVTLELGGKSPTIVDETADLEQAAEAIAFGKWSNSGQICIAPDYVLVQARVHDAFVAALCRRIARSFGSDEEARARTPDYARMINARQFERVRQLFESAVEGNARVVIGGCFDAEERYVAPTVLIDVPSEAEIMSEEIFGPLLPVVRYETLDEAIALINGKPNPLALYIFSRDDQHIERTLAETTAGGTCVNDTLLHFAHPELPFGGVGLSGIGKGYHRYGFLAFSNERAVVHRRRASPAFRMLYPPYRRKTRRLIGWLQRFL